MWNLFIDDMDLTGLHGRQGLFVVFRRYAGAAGGIHDDGCFRQEGLEEHGVGDDADIGAQSDQGDAAQLAPAVPILELLGKGHTAEGGLVKGLF